MDPTLKRLASYPDHDDLAVADVATILGLSESSVRRNLSALEHKRHGGRGQGKRNYRFTPTAIVIYLVRITHGDCTALLADIAAQCPQYLEAAKAAIRGKAIPAPATPIPAEPLPENVVCITTGTRKRRPATDPYKGCPELFPITEITRPQTA